MNKTLRVVMLGAATIFAQEAANAGSFLKNSGGKNSNNAAISNIYGYVYEMNSTVVTEEQLTKSCVEATAGIVQDRMQVGKSAGNANFFTAGRGDNAGSSKEKMGVWAKYRWDKIDDKTTGGQWNAKQHTLAFGGDYMINCNVVAGLALVYAHTTGDTKFNNGKIKDNAYGFAPYAKVMVNDMIDFDMVAGYYRVRKDRTRTALGQETGVLANSNPGFNAAGTKIKSKPKSNRWFIAPAVNVKKQIEKADLHLRLGYIFAEDQQKAFNETGADARRVRNAAGTGIATAATANEYNALKTKVNRFTSRLNVGFMVHDMVTPYATVFYYRDGSVQHKNKVFENATNKNPFKSRGRNTFGGGLGAKFMPMDNVTGNIGYEYAKNKSVKNHAVKLEARYRF